MLGDKLRELRKKHNKTQAELGRLLGTDQSGYSKIENGIHSLPVSLLGTVANYYQITIDELLDFELEQPRSEIEKAYEKLDFHRINYIIDEDDFVKIPISKDYCFKVPTKKYPHWFLNWRKCVTTHCGKPEYRFLRQLFSTIFKQN